MTENPTTDPVRATYAGHTSANLHWVVQGEARTLCGLDTRPTGEVRHQGHVAYAGCRTCRTNAARKGIEVDAR